MADKEGHFMVVKFYDYILYKRNKKLISILRPIEFKIMAIKKNLINDDEENKNIVLNQFLQLQKDFTSDDCRLFIERRSPFKGDTKHFHHRMLAIGFSVRETVLIIYTFCAAFGVSALVLQGAQKKLLAIIVMTILMALFGGWVVYRSYKIEKKVE